MVATVGRPSNQSWSCPPWTCELATSLWRRMQNFPPALVLNRCFDYVPWKLWPTGCRRFKRAGLEVSKGCFLLLCALNLPPVCCHLSKVTRVKRQQRKSRVLRLIFSNFFREIKECKQTKRKQQSTPTERREKTHPLTTIINNPSGIDLRKTAEHFHPKDGFYTPSCSKPSST